MQTPALLSIICAIPLLATCGTQPAEFTAEDQATIRKMFDARVANIRAGDWTAWSLQHADSIIVQPPNAPALNGRAAILAWGKSFPPVDSLVLSNIRIWGEGNVAYATSAYTLKLRDLPVDTGKELLVFRRPSGGTWEVVLFSLSSDSPPAPPGVTATREVQ